MLKTKRKQEKHKIKFHIWALLIRDKNKLIIIEAEDFFFIKRKFIKIAIFIENEYFH